MNESSRQYYQWLRDQAQAAKQAAKAAEQSDWRQSLEDAVARMRESNRQLEESLKLAMEKVPKAPKKEPAPKVESPALPADTVTMRTDQGCAIRIARKWMDFIGQKEVKAFGDELATCGGTDVLLIDDRTNLTLGFDLDINHAGDDGMRKALMVVGMSILHRLPVKEAMEAGKKLGEFGPLTAIGLLHDGLLKHIEVTTIEGHPGGIRVKLVLSSPGVQLALNQPMGFADALSKTCTRLQQLHREEAAA